jgi:hypothetical protein
MLSNGLRAASFWGNIFSLSMKNVGFPDLWGPAHSLLKGSQHLTGANQRAPVTPKGPELPVFRPISFYARLKGKISNWPPASTFQRFNGLPLWAICSLKNTPIFASFTRPQTLLNDRNQIQR